MSDWQWPAGDQHFTQYDPKKYQRRSRDLFIEHIRDHVWSSTEPPITGFERAELVIDVGAHVGTWTQQLVEHSQEVWAIEPVHTELLKQNIENCSAHPERVRVFDLVLSTAANQPVTLWRAQTNSGDSGIDLGPGQDRTAIERHTDTLDLLWHREGCPAVTGIKIDVQGHELAVLQGARELLERDGPVLCLELNAGNTLTALWLQGLGYEHRDRRSKDWIWRRP